MTNSELQLLAILVVLAMLSAGAVVATLGFRGRFVATEPQCAACGQRISPGEYERSGRCPECGNDVTAPDGIRYFTRRRRYGVVALGIGLACFSLAGFGLPFRLARWRDGPPPSATTPVAELARAMETAEDIRVPGMDEALRRAATGALSATDLDRLVEAMIAFHERQRMDWMTTEETQLLAAAQAMGALRGEQIARLGATLFDAPSLPIPKVVRVGEGYAPWNETSREIDRNLALVRVEVSDTVLPLHGHNSATPVDRLDDNVQGGVRFTGPLGSHVLRATFEAEYFWPAPGGLVPSQKSPPVTVIWETVFTIKRTRNSGHAGAAELTAT